jgi:hypothetical protein
MTTPNRSTGPLPCWECDAYVATFPTDRATAAGRPQRHLAQAVRADIDDDGQTHDREYADATVSPRRVGAADAAAITVIDTEDDEEPRGEVPVRLARRGDSATTTAVATPASCAADQRRLEQP